SGTVRNLPNGNVEIEVTANDTDLETFLDYLRVGPSMSRVTDILVTETDISYSDGFEAIF
ncbi:MAG: acylphosphatase, partial [Verrucomicrobiota bacterium]|nr:acylphosphatase [Verrucomicrobiota bacterium]